MHGTSPVLVDTDDDDMADGWEITYGLDPLDYAYYQTDTDGDGWSDIEEYRLGGDPTDAASGPQLQGIIDLDFEDGIVPPNFYYPGSLNDPAWYITETTAQSGTKSLGVEYQGVSLSSRTLYWTIYVPEGELVVPRQVAGDGYYDRLEMWVDGQSQNYLRDTAGNWGSQTFVLDEGVHTIQLRKRFDTGSLTLGEGAWIDDLYFIAYDADEDGMNDSWELENGFDPADPSDALGDADGDGLANAAEFEAGTDVFAPDSDGDGLTDGDEVAVYYSDPTRTDTDGDTIPDGWEVANGLDPADPCRRQSGCRR